MLATNPEMGILIIPAFIIMMVLGLFTSMLKSRVRKEANMGAWMLVTNCWLFMFFLLIIIIGAIIVLSTFAR